MICECSSSRSSRRRSYTSTPSIMVTLLVSLGLVMVIFCGVTQAASVGKIQIGQQDLKPEESTSTDVEEAAPRTFGRPLRLMKNFMLPMLLALGGIKMLLMFLTLISLKTLAVSVAILVLNISVGLAKIIHFFKYGNGVVSLGGGGGIGVGGTGFGAPLHGPPEKTVNVHVHADPSHQLLMETPTAASFGNIFKPSSSFAPTFSYARKDVLEPIFTDYPKMVYSQKASSTNEPFAAQWERPSFSVKKR
ncbi:uncharacterized protein LOC129755013 [Uranotaenia lowii]|uniref:uncharacterized protein LOC129755013 n=1 Tax=Uranotaenia lowii TaxID=190385 RepID=UPI00247950DB|nr:uncharacterized protein LOC129755013 [Uranotaenia lowii]